MKEIKTGYKTTEFWLTLLATIGGLVIAIYQAIKPDEAEQVRTAWDGVARVTEVALPILLPIVLGNQYITSRAALKLHGK